MAYDGFDLSGKLAVITGGVGLGFARTVAAAEAGLSVRDTNAQRSADAKAELQAIKPSASATLCDLANEAAVEQAMAGVIKRYGRIDACFPNARIGTRNTRPFHDSPTGKFLKPFATFIQRRKPWPSPL